MESVFSVHQSDGIFSRKNIEAGQLSWWYIQVISDPLLIPKQDGSPDLYGSKL